MEPYSYRSKLTDNNKIRKASKHDRIASRLYTIKPQNINNSELEGLKDAKLQRGIETKWNTVGKDVIESNNHLLFYSPKQWLPVLFRIESPLGQQKNQQFCKDSLHINIEDHTPNWKYDSFLDNSLDTNQRYQKGFTGDKNRNITGHKGMSSNSKLKLHRHKHSNSDTILNSSYYNKSNQNVNLTSKYRAKKSKSPDENPSLTISKKPIETIVEGTNKHMIISKVAGKNYIK